MPATINYDDEKDKLVPLILDKDINPHYFIKIIDKTKDSDFNFIIYKVSVMKVDKKTKCLILDGAILKLYMSGYIRTDKNKKNISYMYGKIESNCASSGIYSWLEHCALLESIDEYYRLQLNKTGAIYASKNCKK